MFKLDEFEKELEELEVGQTIRVNHESCGAGEDTRRRLYLTRTLANPQMVIGYCHNCQESAWKLIDDNGYRDARHGVLQPKTITDKKQDEVVPPSDMIPTVRDMPTYAQAWVWGRGLDQKDLDDYGIMYDPDSDRIYIPRFSTLVNGGGYKGKLIGYQLRRVANNNQAKYLTVAQHGVVPWSYIIANAGQGLTSLAVLVEDLVSAIAIGKAMTGSAPEIDVFVLHGTKVDPTLMYTVARGYDMAIVWLDNDNDHVIEQAELMQRRILLYSENIEVLRVAHLSDPKNSTSSRIEAVLSGGSKWTR
jgi:hypothetical protein